MTENEPKIDVPYVIAIDEYPELLRKRLFTDEQRAAIERKLLDHIYEPPSRIRRRRGGVEFREIFRQLAVYLEPRDWWIGYYRGTSHHYVCPLPCLVIRWNRR